MEGNEEAERNVTGEFNLRLQRSLPVAAEPLRDSGLGNSPSAPDQMAHRRSHRGALRVPRASARSRR